MSPFNRNTAELLIYAFLTLAETETHLKLKIQDFLAKPYTTKELYSFLGDIQTDLTERYLPPEEDEARMIDLEWCEDQISKSLAV
jgi:YesN/AraC family two-component response regulator